MKRYLLLSLIVPALSAATITTYNYTGNDFTQVTGTGGPTTSDFISFSFELQSPLSSNLLDVLSLSIWSINDGVDFLSNQTSGTVSIDVSTDAFGNIINWQVQIFSGDLFLSTVDPPYTCCPGPLDQSAIYGNGPNFAATAIANDATVFVDGNIPESGIPGTWSVTTVPEPSNLTTVALSLASLWLLASFISHLRKYTGSRL